MNVWNSGADGVFIFNNSGLKKEDLIACIHEPLDNVLEYAGYDKDYFVSTRGPGAVAGSCYPHNEFINIPVLNPHNPIKIEPENCKYTFIQLGDEGDYFSEKSFTLMLFVKDEITPDNITVYFNGGLLQEGLYNHGAIAYRIDEKLIKSGTNIIFIHNKSKNEIILTDTMIKVRTNK